MKEFGFLMMGGIGLILVPLAVIGTVAGGAKGVQQQAIEAGVAEWQVDPKTGETSFVWRKCQ